MVSQKDIKGLDFETIEDYFEYIHTSKRIGQRKQAQELYAKLSPNQQLDFIEWFTTSTYYEGQDEGVSEMKALLEMIRYVRR